jgi:hypothetical protein
MESRPSQGTHPDNVRERAVRMMVDDERRYGSQAVMVCSVFAEPNPKAEMVGCRCPALRRSPWASINRINSSEAELNRHWLRPRTTRCHAVARLGGRLAG